MKHNQQVYFLVFTNFYVNTSYFFGAPFMNPNADIDNFLLSVAENERLSLTFVARCDL